MDRRRPFRWRKLLRDLHRDVGYAVAFLVVVYAISGIAVNHVSDWNPNYRVEVETRSFPPFAPADRDEAVRRLVAELRLPGPPREAFRSSPTNVRLFYDGWTVRADTAAGRAEIEHPRERFLVYDLNWLHLNRGQGLWTWFADLFALALLFLGLSGPFLLTGKNGLAGRGKWLVLAGILVPLAFLLLRRLG